jgi:uncharacterized protein
VTAPPRITSLVTGASAGIGAAFAHALAARGHDLILTARRLDRLDALAAELRRAHGVTVTTIAADLAAPDAAAALAAAMDARGLQVDWLVNNAGYGVPGTFDASDWPRHQAFLRVLLEVPTELVWRLLPALRSRGYGRIINVASLAGLVPAPAGHTLYGATKAYLIKVSQALAAENEDRDIRVLALCPGFTRSEFHDVTGTRSMMDRMPRWIWQSTEAVVAEALAALDANRIVHVTGRLNRALAAGVKLLPERLAMGLMRREGRRYRTGRD